MRILLIEDEAALAQNLLDFFAKEELHCEWAATKDAALDQLLDHEFALILLDITLPDGNGLEVLAYVKEHAPKTGVLIISAKNALDDKLKGFDLGADDYITKPFHLPELNARIRAYFRRTFQSGSDAIDCGPLSLWPDKREVRVHGDMVDLTGKEFDLLLYLLTNQNRVLTKMGIAEHLWGDFRGDSEDYDFVYQHIKNLRKKLHSAHCPPFVENVYGLGYKFNSRLV